MYFIVCVSVFVCASAYGEVLLPRRAKWLYITYNLSSESQLSLVFTSSYSILSLSISSIPFTESLGEGREERNRGGEGAAEPEKWSLLKRLHERDPLWDRD